MRTIKYRVYNKVWGMMIDKEIYNLGIDETGIHKVEWINTTTDGQEHKEIWENPDDFTVMQFTGLQDKNDVDIYEGDIVHWKQASGGILSPDENTYTCQIKWLRKEWVCEDIKPLKDDYHSCFTFASCHMEVIGNLYQNPELLN